MLEPGDEAGFAGVGLCKYPPGAAGVAAAALANAFAPTELVARHTQMPARLPNARDLLLVTLGTMDLRRNPEKSPVSLRPSFRHDPASLSVVIWPMLSDEPGGSVNSTYPSATNRVTVPFPLRSTVSGEEIPFVVPTGRLRAVRFNVDLVVSSPHPESKVVARGTSPLLGDANPESLWGERHPIAGRIFISLFALSPNTNEIDVVGEMLMEVVAVTWYSNPKAFVPFHNDDPWPEMKLIGHRGMGMNKVLVEHKASLQLRENTIPSFAMAEKLGAEYIECDVQLTQDGVPVLYHDFQFGELDVPISMTETPLSLFKTLFPPPSNESVSSTRRAMRRSRSSENFAIPFSPPPPPQKRKYFGTPFIQAPLCTLKEALETLPSSLGINVEFKYALREECEMEHFFSPECNKYVDTVLDVIMEYGGDRRFVFSSFHPECCRMLRLKQTRYPTHFLTGGGAYLLSDARCNSLAAAARFAIVADLSGVVTEAEVVLRHPRLVKRVQDHHGAPGSNAERGLRLTTYGGGNSVPGNALALKAAGADGVIVDRVKQVAIELGLFDGTQPNP
ncbi:Glycerophosphoryl diester phosphodiesterase family-domain-containing protein [Zopfochytrium polystomum]|nr:Glycerophosphoryl diester phosphodiesterase family-domain-containing protein [Zopfochytrium polystomum]